MRRSANFIVFPGTGMWMTFGKYQNQPDNYGDFMLIRYLPVDKIREYAKADNMRVFWIDQGIGASTLMKIRHGGKSASATEVTERMVNQYLREKEQGL
jgi:hypothetical protein